MLLMSKGSKETVLIVTHVERVERLHHVYDIDTFNDVKRVERLCYVKTRVKHIFAHNFLNI